MDLNKFPNYMPLDHTMVFSLNEYVRQKLPVELFKKALIKKWNIEIHGVYPDIFMKYYKCLGFDLIENISFSNTSPNKRYNYIRPKFFVGYKKNKSNTLIIAVTPGENYILHYASIIRFYLNTLTLLLNQVTHGFSNSLQGTCSAKHCQKLKYLIF